MLALALMLPSAAALAQSGEAPAAEEGGAEESAPSVIEWPTEEIEESAGDAKMPESERKAVDSRERFEQMKLDDKMARAAERYTEDSWVLTAEPYLFLNVQKDSNGWTQTGYGISLERFYHRFHYLLGMRLFKEFKSSIGPKCGVSLTPGGEQMCVSRIPDSMIGFYAEIGGRHGSRGLFVKYAGGLEINRYDLSFETQNDFAVRFSGHTGYRFANYGLGVGLYSSLSSRRITWGAGVDMFLLY